MNRQPHFRLGFTLLELLVVLGLIGVLSAFLVGGLGSGGESAAVHSAQASVANLVTLARLKAAATNRKTRLLVSLDPRRSDRYLKFIVLQVGRQPGANPTDWEAVQSVTLPPGTGVVPAALTGLVADEGLWKRVSDPTDNLTSDLFLNQLISYQLEGDSAAEFWTGVAFTPNGTLAALGGGPPPRGAIVLARVETRPIGSFEAGEPPVTLVAPAEVRGLMLSAYGVPAPLNERSAF